MSETIKVLNWLGSPKELTRDQFLECWLEHVRQLRILSYEKDWQDRVDLMVRDVTARVDLEFKRLREEQS